MLQGALTLVLPTLAQGPRRAQGFENTWKGPGTPTAILSAEILRGPDTVLQQKATLDYAVKACEWPGGHRNKANAVSFCTDSIDQGVLRLVMHRHHFYLSYHFQPRNVTPELCNSVQKLPHCCHPPYRSSAFASDDIVLAMPAYAGCRYHL